MKSSVVDFIKRRFEDTDANWMNGNCYWFASILCQRFPKLNIYYEPIDGHFLAGDGYDFYDWTGEVKISADKLYKFDNLLIEDELLYARLIRDCVM